MKRLFSRLLKFRGSRTAALKALMPPSGKPQDLLSRVQAGEPMAKEGKKARKPQSRQKRGLKATPNVQDIRSLKGA